MSEQFEERMAGASGFAALIFVLSTIYYAMSNQSVDVLTSVPGIVFFLVGSVVAMFFVGVPYYVIERDFARFLSRFIRFNSSSVTAWVIRSLGTGLLVLQILFIYVVTKWMFVWYFAA